MKYMVFLWIRKNWK